MGVSRNCVSTQIRVEIGGALHYGVEVIEVIGAASRYFSARRGEGLWEMEIWAPAQEVAEAVEALLGASEVLVERMTKSGKRVFDARSAILLMESVSQSAVTAPAHTQMPPECVILHVVVRHVVPSVRPDDVLTALKQVGTLEPRKPVRVTRLAQGPLTEVSISIQDPFDPDRVLV